jgi:S1/P1 Nuclease
MDLTWLFHLVGDIHQPLHTIALDALESRLESRSTSLRNKKLGNRE